MILICLISRKQALIQQLFTECMGSVLNTVVQGRVSEAAQFQPHAAYTPTGRPSWPLWWASDRNGEHSRQGWAFSTSLTPVRRWHSSWDLKDEKEPAREGGKASEHRSRDCKDPKLDKEKVSVSKWGVKGEGWGQAAAEAGACSQGNGKAPQNRAGEWHDLVYVLKGSPWLLGVTGWRGGKSGSWQTK